MRAPPRLDRQALFAQLTYRITGCSRPPPPRIVARSRGNGTETMKSTLIKCGWLVTLDPKSANQGRRDPARRQPHQGGRPQPQCRRRRDHRRHRQDRDAGPRQRAHAHLGNGAARHRRGMDDAGLSASTCIPISPPATSPRTTTSPTSWARWRRSTPACTTLVDWCHNITRIEHGRARGRRPDRQRHPRGVRAWHREADRPRRAACRSPTCRIRASASRRCARGGLRATTAA